MSSTGDTTEAPADTPSPASGWDARRAAKVVLWALLYAGAVALLVVFAPSTPHHFIYQEF
jgi:hypothetical protein